MRLSKDQLAARLSCDAGAMPGRQITVNPNIAGKTAHQLLMAKANRDVPNHGASGKPAYQLRHKA